MPSQGFDYDSPQKVELEGIEPWPRPVAKVLDTDHHSATERETLHRFLSRRIDQVRHDERSTLSWRDALETLFDYRRWHTFRIMVRHARFGDRAVAFTSRKVSLSAGEKALVLSLPLFAAVASHYMPRDAAGIPRTCPRLLLLDEVFPKNDRANKRQILGLLTELDLDCVLTSDKDRCDYDTVDGIAIAVISKAGDLSYSTRLVWNGHTHPHRSRTDRPRRPRRPGFVTGQTDRVERAARILAAPGLAPVVAELARRMGASARAVTSITVALTDEQRAALAGLLGEPRLPPQRARVRTDRLTAALDVTDLRAVVEAVHGPLGDRAAARAHERAALDAAVAAAETEAVPLGPTAAAWAAGAVRALPGPVTERAETVAAVTRAVIEAASCRGLPLAVIATDTTGDPRAFDPGTRGGELLVACAAATEQVDVPRTALDRRRLLARTGIVADELSSTVLVWNFPFPPDHALATTSSGLTAAGEPTVVTLSMLQRWPASTTAPRLLVVENPAIVAVAAATGYSGTLVCSSGQPSAACVNLVSDLVSAGTHVDVHADFDPGGFSIVTTLAQCGARPWRMTADDYMAALERAGPDRTARRLEMTGPVPATPWDPALAAAYEQHRRPVYEEQLREAILGHPS